MALAEIKFYSESLGVQTQCYVILPQQNLSGEMGTNSAQINVSEYKTLYLLHGLSDDYSIWLRRTSIERYATKYGIAVVMPSADRSFYTDMKYGGKYYTYVSDELGKIMRSFFPLSDKREDNYIAGLSMGGYGALKIGMKRCDSFCAAAGVSSVADIRACAQHFPPDYVNIFGDELFIPEDEDLFYIAEQADGKSDKPRIYMGVGTEDFLYEQNVALKQKFESLNFDYTYMESPGTHNWEFWDEYIQYILEWMFNK